MRTSKTIEKEVIRTFEDAEGNITKEITRTTSKMKIDNEPDFIKIYTKMWCEYNQIPYRYRQLFFSLACRMSYCISSNPEASQIVFVQKPITDAILEECGWKTKDPLMKGLKVLCDCKAIKKLSRACYQINPAYAGRGEWKYNPRLERGGVKDLITTFEFDKNTVKTQIVFADDGSNDNDFEREHFEVQKSDEAVVIRTNAEYRNMIAGRVPRQ